MGATEAGENLNPQIVCCLCLKPQNIKPKYCLGVKYKFKKMIGPNRISCLKDSEI